MAGRLCSTCGRMVTRGAPPCHPARPGANHVVHADPRWTALSKRMIARHVGEYGWVCPGDGDEHPPHPTADLTLDHVVPLEEGGAPFDSANTRVLCKSRNSALGARLVNARRAGQLASRIPAPLDERSEIRARYIGG